MITPKNQAAIAVLNDIYAGGDTARTDACRLTEQDMDTLLSKLSSAGLIMSPFSISSKPRASI